MRKMDRMRTTSGLFMSDGTSKTYQVMKPSRVGMASRMKLTCSSDTLFQDCQYGLHKGSSARHFARLGLEASQRRLDELQEPAQLMWFLLTLQLKVHHAISALL